MIYRRFYGFPTWESRSPFAELERIRRQMERQLEGWPIQRQTSGVFPLINLTENKDSFFIRAELPGMSSGDLDMQATSNSVSISGATAIVGAFSDDDRGSQAIRRPRLYDRQQHLFELR